MAKMGRPQIEIKKDEFEKLCGLQCSLREIAGWYKCSEDTIERWCKKTYNTTFAEAYKVHSASGKIGLRRMQYKLAEKSYAMAIWLGKQWLGQTDKIETDVKEELPTVQFVFKDLSGGEQ